MRKAVLCTGGVNRADDPKAIRDDEVVRAKNIIPGIVGAGGVIATRKALSHRFNFGAVDAYPLGLKVPIGIPGIDAVFVTRNFSSGAQTLLSAMGASGSPVLQAVLNHGPIQRNPCFVQMESQLAVFSGDDVQRIAQDFEVTDRAPCGTVLRRETDLDRFPNECTLASLYWAEASNNFAPRVGCMYMGRFLFGNLGPGYESYFGFADRGWEPASNGVLAPIGEDFLAANGRNIIAGNVDGDGITAMVPVMLSSLANPSQTGVFILKEFWAGLIAGEPNQTTDSTELLDTLDLAESQVRCGCVGFATVAYTPYGVIWAGPDDVWLFEGGQAPRRLGTKIRPVLQQSPAHLRYRWHAAYFDGYYRLALFSEGQGPNDDSPCGEQWWLDLTKGPPASPEAAAWFGPMVYNVPDTENTAATPGTWTMDVDARTDVQPALLGMFRSMVPVQGQTNPQVGIVQAQYDSGDAAGGRDVGYFELPSGPRRARLTEYALGDIVIPGATYDNGHYYKVITAGNTPDADDPTWPVDGTSVVDGDVVWEDQGMPLRPGTAVGTTILRDILTKDYNFGDPVIDKLYQGTQFSVQNSHAMRLFVEAILDGGRATDVEPSNGSAAPGTLLGVDTFDTPNLSKEFRAKVSWADPDTRALGKHIQLHIYDTAEIVLDTDLLSFDFGVLADPPTETVLTATLLTNAFTDLATLVSAIVTAMNAAMSTGIPGWTGTVTHNFGNQPRNLISQITSVGTGDFLWRPRYSLTNGRATRYIFSLLGYDTNKTLLADDTQPTDTAVHDDASASIELGGIIILTEPIPREPA